MDSTRNWTDPRDGKVWVLIRGLGMDVVFIRGGDRRTALLHRLAELDSLTDKELEIRLDQAQKGGTSWTARRAGLRRAPRRSDR